MALFNTCMSVGKIFFRNRLLKSVICNTIRTDHTCESLLKNVLQRYRDIELGPYRVNDSGGFGLAFSHAQVHVFPYCVDKDNKIVDPYLIDYEQSTKLHSFSVDFRTLFHGGLKEVDRIVSSKQEDSSLSSVQTRLVKAVKTLENFVENKEYHEECLFHMAGNKTASYTELDITVLLANHLFLPLISFDPGNHLYGIISNDSKNKVSKCPCSRCCDAKIVYGNSGFGSGYLWFGRSDIMLYPVGGGTMSIIVKDQGEGESLINIEEHNPRKTYRQIIEVKCNGNQLRMHKSVTQVTSQAITFSLFQKKYQMERMKNPKITTLIPTIFASRHYFDLYLYDSENDVLLRNLGEPLPIFEKKLTDRKSFCPKFDLNSILQLWMLINHLLLQPSLTVKQVDRLRGTCGIKEQIESSNLMKRVEDSLETGSTFVPPALQDGYSVHKIVC